MQRNDRAEWAQAGVEREPMFTVVPGSWNDFECLEQFPAPEPSGSTSWVAEIKVMEVAAMLGGAVALAASLMPSLL